MKLLVITLLAILGVSFADNVVEENINVGSDKEVKLRPPRFPSPGRRGEKQIWTLKADQGKQIQLVCDTLSIGLSDGCSQAYLEVNDGQKVEKYCGSKAGMTIRSKQNEMKVVFELISLSGIIDCGVVAKSPENSEELPDDGTIPLKLGESYDKIFFISLDRGVSKSWTFKPESGVKVGIRCRFSFFGNPPCNEEGMTIGQEVICSYGQLNKVFDGNVNVAIKSARGEGYVDCIVQGVDGSQADQFKNVASHEIDSSERGTKSGLKSTSCPCGWSKKQKSRIVNGLEVKTGEYPWVVALKSDSTHFCGGSIISEHHILTAAHCTFGKKMSDITVTVGSVNRKEGGEDFKVSLIREHRYDKHNSHVNDIAIITLDRKITFSDTVGPVCLTPFQPKLDNNYITVAGWGYLDSINYEHPEIMRKAHLKVVNYKTCTWHYFRKFEKDQNRFCIWANDKDTCMGDSGSPVVWLDPETNRYTQLGLVSFGRGCNTDHPKVTTFVPHYYQWIQKEVQQNPRGTATCRRLG